MGNDTAEIDNITDENQVLNDDSVEEKKEEKKERKKRKSEKRSNKLLKKFKENKKFRTITIIVVILALLAGAFFINKSIKSKKNSQQDFSMVKVERQTIENIVTGSSTLQASNSYDVMALVTGEILSDTFNEGDKVNKNDIMYKIEATTAQNNVTTANNALVKAEQSYKDAVKNKTQNSKTNNYSIQNAQNSLEKSLNSYNDALNSKADLDIKSDCEGTVKEVYVKVGDSIQNGAKIADVYNDTYMEIQLPFNENDAANIYNGMSAKLRVSGANDTLWGTVTSVSDASVATSNHAIVKYVTIELENPGALTTNDSATAEVGDYVCSDVANFQYIDTNTITAKTAGKIFSVNIKENDRVYDSETVVNMTSDTLDTTLNNAQLSLNDAQIALQKTILSSDEYSQDTSIKNAALAVDDAKLSLEKSKKTLEDYTIKAPISGTVVKKNKKAGDKMDNTSGSSASSTSSGNSSAMAIIYDLTNLKFQLDIDETEIADVKVGQTVSITADAVSGKTFEGEISTVGVNGTSTNGVTTYPVEVIVKEYGELLPGMNVDATITVARAENVLALPVDTINRGNVVYVTGDKTDDKDHAPDGFKSVQVQTGLNNDTYIEIKSGLEEGDEVRGKAAANGNDKSGSVGTQQQQMGGMPGGGMQGGGMQGGGMQGGGMQGGSRSSGGTSGGMR